MTKYIVAVSGGVDSVALLDMLKRVPGHELVVAHFDHGIREDSRHDANFVSALARKYRLPFETIREELGQGASEELARERRYAFLRSIADKHDARIVTAHHSDDAVETIAINLTRGTGWRGLAVLDSDIIRPLLHTSKSQLHKYAKDNQLVWHEDSTNSSDDYLRNRIRKSAKDISDDHKLQLLALRHQQLESKQIIDKEVRRLVGLGPSYSRYFFTHVPKAVAIECLRFVTNAQLTRPQLERLLHAIKTASTGSTYQAGSGINLSFTTRNFSL